MFLSKILTSNKVKLIIYIILTTLLLYARDVLGIGINKNIFIILVISFSLTLKYNNLISLILFTLPLMCGLPGNYFLPVWCILIIYHQIKRGSFNWQAFAFWGIIVMWELCIYGFYSYKVIPIIVIGYLATFLLFCALVTENSKLDYKTPILSFIIGCCVLLGIIYLILLNDTSLREMDGSVRLGGDFYANTDEMSLKTNANNIGYLSVTSIACLFTLFYYKKIKLLPFLILVCIAFFCGMFSVSRTWALSLAILLIAYFFFQKENRIRGYGLLFLVFVIGIYYVSQNPIILDAFIGRFTGENIETAGGRSDLFAMYNDFLLNHPWNLFLGTSAQIYKEVTGIFYSTHNSLQQIWLSYGICGFILIISVYIRQLRFHYTSKEYMACVPMLVSVLFLQSIQLLNPHYGLYPIIAAFFVMKMIKNERQTIK